MARAPKYHVAGESFASKGAALKRGQEILRSTPIGCYTLGQDLCFLTELFERYRQTRNKEHLAVIAVEVEPNSIGSWKGFRAYYEDGSSGDISYRNAANSLNGYDPHPGQVKAAMREAIQPQIIEFRHAEIRRGIDPDFAISAEVDHLPPWEFCNLADNFLEKEGIIHHDITLEKWPDFRGAHLPEPLAERWREFHEEFAILELVSKEKHKQRTIARQEKKKPRGSDGAAQQG